MVSLKRKVENEAKHYELLNCAPYSLKYLARYLNQGGGHSIRDAKN